MSYWSHAAQPRRWGFSPSAALGLGAAVCGLGYVCGGTEPGGLSSALSAAALLNGALLAHEAGHLAAARALGVAVREFSVGVGPRVAWWQGTTTTYSLRALPLFGYVSFLTAAHLAAGAAGGAANAAAATFASAGDASGRAASAGTWHHGHYARWRQPVPAAAATAVAGGAPAGHAAAAGARRGAMLLECLPPGRRALVVAAGVATNVLLAAAFVGWQVLSYGELGVVVRPGARVRLVDGWDGSDGDGADCGGEAAAPATTATAVPRPHHPAAYGGGGASRRLAAGDVVLRVGERWLPAGGDMDAAFVAALEEAAAAASSSSPASRPCTGAGGADGMGGISAGGSVAQSVDGVKMLVLRTHSHSGSGSGGVSGSHSHGCCCGGGACSGEAHSGAGSGASGSCSGGGGGATTSTAAAAGPATVQEVLTMDAADVLRYETLVVGPNAVAGYRRPRDAVEAAAMTGREMVSWAFVVLGCWAEAVGAAAASAAAAAGVVAPLSSPHHGGGGASSRSGSGSGDAVQLVGPLGLVASAAAAAVAAERESRAPSCMAAAEAAVAATATAADGATDVSAATAAAAAHCGVSAREPSPLLGLGIQLNLQLAAVNLLPVPVLDGGQLVLLALEAVRGGRRLPPALERAGLALSGVTVAGWLAALSLGDLIGLADKAAGRLAIALSPPSGAVAAGIDSRPMGQQAGQPFAATSAEDARGADWGAALAA